MKKTVAGFAVIVSILSLSGCGKSSADKAAQSSKISSSKASVSYSLAESSSKEAREKVENAEWAVNGLFAEKEDSYEEYNYNKLFEGTSVSDVENVEHQVDSLPQTKDRTKLQKRVAIAMKLAKTQEPSVTMAQSKADESSLAKQRSESINKKSLSINNSVAKNNESSSNKKTSTTKTTTGPRYKKIGLESFANNPEKYVGQNIETSGEVSYIQKNPDDKNIYYVVILPKDDKTSSGYSFGTVTEINIDTMDETPIQEGDNITVKGGALTSTLKLNGKTLKSDIVVDSISIN